MLPQPGIKQFLDTVADRICSIRLSAPLKLRPYGAIEIRLLLLLLCNTWFYLAYFLTFMHYCTLCTILYTCNCRLFDVVSVIRGR